MRFESAAGPRTPVASRAAADEGAPTESADLIAQAHQRSASYGLRPYESPDFCPVRQSELKMQIERSQSLFTYALPVMETLYDQIVNTQSMVILTDAAGLILHSLGDDDFLAMANKVALRPGAVWSEESRGTNAIGTALAENRATLVHGAEHFLEANQFLTCSCTTILDPYGKTVGALDVTGDHRSFHKHTMALVRMSAQMIENQLFANAFQDMVCVRFHSRAEFLGTLMEGMVSFTPAGRFLSANRSGQFQLSLSNGALHAHTFSSLFGLSMSQLFDAVRQAPAGIVQLQLPSGVKVNARVEWKTRAASIPGGAIEAGRSGMQDAAPLLRNPAAVRAQAPAGLDDLDTGDAQIKAVIGKLRKVIGKDIPVMVLGETGTGKELMARAIHADSPRHAGPFIAVNCASIPENLIESELFGYEEGAFTGARKKGGIGKMLLANGGTLFLDEIGDMPLHLQARLLRALQERAVTPLGSNKVICVDVSVVCATNRNLREQVANGQFREDLYYRLNGLVVRLPALRERSDLDVVAGKLLRESQETAEPPRISESVMGMFRSYHWPGNIRQLGNLLRTARLMAEGDPEITEDHLPDDFLDDLKSRQGQPAALPQPAPAAGAHEAARAVPTRLADVETLTILEAVKAHHGNISAAAKALGISRNTVYRKMEEARGQSQPGN